MKRRWLVGFVAFATLLISLVVVWLHSSSLKVERTIIAELPKGINHLVRTDLDNDGEFELVAICFANWSSNIPAWHIHQMSEIEDPRLWLILSPLKNPKLKQLPYVCRLNLPSRLQFSELLVEWGEWRDFGNSRVWLPWKLGWMRIRNGQVRFEPICETQWFTQRLLSFNKSLTLLIGNELPSFPPFLRLPRKHEPKQRFAFRLLPNGKWQPIDPTKIRPTPKNWNAIATGDFDGDGSTDYLKLQWQTIGRRQHGKLQVSWGNGYPEMDFPVSQTFSQRMKFLAADIDDDGQWEILTLPDYLPVQNQWELTIWRLKTDERCFVAVAKVAGKIPFNQPYQRRTFGISKSAAPSPLVAALPSPQIRVTPNINIADFNSDGRKDFLLVWTKTYFASCGLGITQLPPPECVAVQLVCGKEMKLRSFAAHEVPFAKPLNLQVWSKQRLAFIQTSHKRIRPTFRLLSLRPFRLQLWESFYEPQCVILRLPEGEEAFNLRSWTKLAELPASLRLLEDWNDDGKVDLVLERRVIHGPFGKTFLTSSHASPYKTSTTLYLACIDGSKIRWSKLVPPSSAKLVQTLPIQISNGVALFALWQADDKTILERIRWQTSK